MAELEVLLDSETEDKQDSDFVDATKKIKLKPIADNFNTR